MQTLQEAIDVLQRRPFGPTRPLTSDEAAALAAVFRAYRRGMLGVAQRIVRNHEDAEDVVHDVFARLPVAITRYRDGAFGGWLKQVTTRQALMRVRSTTRRREEAGLLYLVPSHEPGPEDRFPSSERSGAVDVATLVAALPWPLRQVVELRYFHGLKHDAIAGRLGITRSASHIRLCRAIKLLRELVLGAERRVS